MNDAFYQDIYDKHVAKLTDLQVWKICQDYDSFRRKGVIGDCFLRETVNDLLQDEPNLAHVHVVTLMDLIAGAAHRHRSLTYGPKF